ncbi:DUF1311 domain-containing protein [Massilia sp. Dwa41.01b]|uniref:lysozyme inhibitor LprI family protein n=1 Tax=unclassified Massilia TaxID=2609279 RepID=UPI001602FA1E|nr:MULTISPECIES: lysozyme inhibitor LprI family protein [unclassified Massilia]QNA90250.1 DUF1311 domain-containing protein [Massilia sp. Dwa41.01b]QNB01148.1 DUF1311 domain-containing protein [Massilia sp. Se16.2.3]
MTKIGLASLLLFASSLSYGAENAPRTKEYGQCIDRAGAVDPAVLECISGEYARQDKRLNTAYRNLMGSLKGERKKQLLEAQRLWGKYTEANCRFYYDPDGGTSARMFAAECEVTARSERASELEELAKH